MKWLVLISYIVLMWATDVLATLAWKLRELNSLGRREVELNGAMLELQQKLREYKYFAGTHLTAEIFLLLRAFSRATGSLVAMVLQGLPGTGKTSLAYAVYQLLAGESGSKGAAFLLVQVTSEMKGEQLLTADLPFRLELSPGFLVPEEFRKNHLPIEGSSTVELSAEELREKYRTYLHQQGILRAAAELSRLEVKVVLVIDEMDKAPTSNRGSSSIQQGPNAIEESLLDILQTGKLPGKGDKKERTLDASCVLLFICMNFNQRLSPEFIRRVRVIKVGFLQVATEIQLLTQAGVPNELADFMVRKVADPIRAAANYLTYRAPEEAELSIVPPYDVILRLARDLMELVEAQIPNEVLRNLARHVTVPELVASDAELQHLYQIVPKTVFHKYLFELLLRLKEKGGK